MRFKLERSNDLSGWWVITDIENLIIVRFKECAFNETQKVTPLDDDRETLAKVGGASGLARVMSEIGGYVARYHGDIAFKQTYGFIYDAEERLYLYRRKPPVWRIAIDDGTDIQALGISLRKASEWINKVALHGHKD